MRFVNLFRHLTLGIALSTLFTVGTSQSVQADEVSITLDSTVAGTLGSGDIRFRSDGTYLDSYSFQGQAGQQIAITMTSQDLDSYLILLDSNGNSLIQDDDSGGDLNARILYTLPRTDTYTIYANTYSNSTGAYTLSLETITAAETAQLSTPEVTRAVTPSSFFYCDTNRPAPATMGRRKDGAVEPLLEWTGNLNQTQAGLSPAQRCEQVARNLQYVYSRPFLFTAGFINNQPVVCAARSQYGDDGKVQGEAGQCRENGQIMTASSLDDASELVRQIYAGFTRLEQAPPAQPANQHTPPSDGEPIAVAYQFTFSSALAYSDCIEDIIQLYQNPDRLRTQGRESDCLAEVFSRYTSGISRSQALELITAADAYMTNPRRDLVIYPPAGQRRRISQLFGFTYDVDRQSQ